MAKIWTVQQISKGEINPIMFKETNNRENYFSRNDLWIRNMDANKESRKKLASTENYGKIDP